MRQLLKLDTIEAKRKLGFNGRINSPRILQPDPPKHYSLTRYDIAFD
ncbi:unnamed protein product [Linum tenue]|uniref:Uncharacterized protein n=1 Tax=Linum tenue TaxID=586396 RepID=A0AAV0H9X8_9ROSI|nr:unnamed protein product [Linum tenue]